ncbi:hypothetical protein ACF3N7_05365 [Cruoricaptor ignavus]|uniref:hypothetical protein n=1 Tax=Cruoricaptor ignavus TaxID=1118202 RepID=UPI00370D07DA
MVVQQYPYTLEVSEIDGENHRDENGDYTEGIEAFLEIGKCRDEAGSPGQYTITEDGQKVSFSWIVYAPLNTPEIEGGRIVRVVSAGKVRAMGVVKRFYRGQLNCRIWL